MIGVVTPNRQAVIELTFRSTSGQVNTIEASIDTGFNGFLTLPLPQIARLGFPYEGTVGAVLGDGREVALDIFAGTVVWDGQDRDVVVLGADGDVLVGMALLTGSRIILEVEERGASHNRALVVSYLSPRRQRFVHTLWKGIGRVHVSRPNLSSPHTPSLFLAASHSLHALVGL